MTGSSQTEHLALYLLLTTATQGSQVLGQETELHADQVGNGQLCPTGVNHQVRQI